MPRKYKNIKYIVIFLLSCVFIIVFIFYNDTYTEYAPVEMPDIVFFCYVYDDVDERYSSYIDKDGNFYKYTRKHIEPSEYMDYTFLSEPYLEYESYESFSLYDTVDKDELTEKYKLLQEISNNKKYAIDFGYELIDGKKYIKLRQGNTHSIWYGCYYNKSGELSYITLHDEFGGHCSANDERANELYEWYTSLGK